MALGQLHTAVIITVDEARDLVGQWRAPTSTTVPAHVTLLVPFVPPARLDDDVMAKVGSVMERRAPFRFVLGEVGRFPGTVYLAPQPSAPFVQLTTALMAAFPGLEPYGGAYTEIVPHLTVAQGDETVLECAAAAVSALLPIVCDAHETVVLEELEPAWRQWRVRLRTRLGS